jgi:uncharacterized protein (DUF362 family)
MSTESSLTRRQFMVRTAKTCASLAAVGGVALITYDPKGPAGGHGQGEERRFDFSVSGQEGRMAVVRGSDRARSLDRALAALGGIEAFVRPGDRVLLKVNAAFATPADVGATTHPDLVYEMIRKCFGAGAKTVAVTDNPINDPAACFSLTGIGDASKRAGAQLLLPEPRFFRSLSLPGGMLIRNWPVLASPLENADKVIGLSPVKDHHRSGASMSLKNWYGLLGGRRNVFHQDVHGIIKELALLIRPTLVVLDGTMAMISNGPTGGSFSDLKKTDTLIASTDPVAADAFGARLLGRSPADLPFIEKAETAGAGTSDMDRIRPTLLSGE